MSGTSARNQRPAVVATRIGDIDRREREQRLRNTANRHRGRVIALLSLVLCALVAALVLYLSPVFVIEEIEVTGSEHLTSQDMAALVSIPSGTTLLRVDGGSIERSVERDAWVEDATVHRVFPDTLQIVITERKIAAVVEVASNEAMDVEQWAIASDGMWLMAIPPQDSEIGQTLNPRIYEDAAAVLHINDVPYGLTPEIGSYCTDSNVNNALAIVDGMTTELADQVRMVSATDAESTLLTLDNGIQIAFGEAEDIREKERICLEIMEQNPGKVAYINVRVPSRPTWRAI